MKLFIDANILVAVLNKEYPLFPYAARVLSLEKKKYKLTTTAVCTAIAYYFAEKKHGSALAKSKIEVLLQHIEISDCGKKETTLAARNKMIHYLEDGLQYYAALNDNCDYIITHYLEDYYFSAIETLHPESFLKQYFIG